MFSGIESTTGICRLWSYVLATLAQIWVMFDRTGLICETRYLSCRYNALSNLEIVGMEYRLDVRFGPQSAAGPARCLSSIGGCDPRVLRYIERNIRLFSINTLAGQSRRFCKIDNMTDGALCETGAICC